MTSNLTSNYSSQFQSLDLKSPQALGLAANSNLQTGHLQTSAMLPSDGISADASTCHRLLEQPVKQSLKTDKSESSSGAKRQILANRGDGCSAENSNHQSSDYPSYSSGKTFTYDEKFELLSAFLDDEVTEEERCLVNHWLKSDAQLKRSYQQQQLLRKAIRTLSTDDLSDA